MKNITQIINDIIDREGGFVNHPDDKGGPTMYGITLATYKSINPNATIEDLRKLTPSMAYQIYETKYYKSTNIYLLNQIDSKLCEFVLDTAINMGASFAIKSLQRCLNVFNQKCTVYPDIIVDGDIGPKTLSSLQSYLKYRGSAGISVMINALACIKGNRYIELSESNEQNESFVYGWLRTRISII